MRQAMGLHTVEMLHVLREAPCPEPANEHEAFKKANNKSFFRIVLHLLSLIHISSPRDGLLSRMPSSA